MKISPITLGPIPLTPLRKDDTYIEIVGSTNPRINAMSEEARCQIAATLRKHYSNVGITIVNNMHDLKLLVAKKPDLVFLGMKLVLLDETKNYDDSPKVWLSDYLKQHNISYTGSDTPALALEFDKHEAKQKIIDDGLNSSAFFISTLQNPTYDHTLTYPLFIKPTNRGDSKGIDEKSVVYSDKELKSKIQSIHKDCESDALIEEYLPGREFSVAVIEQPLSNNLLAMPIEITAPADQHGHSFLSETVKMADTEEVLQVSNAKLKHSLNELAIGVFKSLCSRGYGRIDMRLDRNGNPSFIEANLMPGLSNHGYLARCFELNQQISYSTMILSIAALGVSRYEDSNSKVFAHQSVAITNKLTNTYPPF